MVTLIKAGGTFAFIWNGNTYTVNFEKLSIKESPEDKTDIEPDFYEFKCSLLEGINIGS